MADYRSASFFQPFSTEPAEVAEQPFIVPPQLGSSSRDLQEQLEKRLLSDDLTCCGIHPNNQFSIEELISKLQKSKRQYCEEELRHVYASLAAYQSCMGTQFVNGKQFVEAYMKRKKELASVLETTHRELETIERMLQQSSSNLTKYSAADQRHTAQIGDESKLTVQVVSIQRVPEASGTSACMYKVHLECQHQVIDTRPVYATSGVAFFNEMFSFQIGSREGDLRANLIQFEPYSSSETVLGDCSIMIEDLADQRKHELTKEIWGAQSAELLLSCQWVYSKKLLYQQYIREFSSKREEKVKDLADYQCEYDKLNMPFLAEQNASMIGILDAGPEYVSNAIEQAMVNMKLSSWQVASHYVVTISFILNCISSYSRCLFLDGAIFAVAFWCNLDPRRWTVNRYTALLLATILSMVLDLTWMEIFFAAWTLNSLESDLHAISKIFSVFLFLWKVILTIFFWKCRYDAKKKASYHNRMNHLQAVSRQAEAQEKQHARLGRMDRQAQHAMMASAYPLLSDNVGTAL